MAHEKNTRKKGGVGKILLVLVVLLALAVGGALLFAHNGDQRQWHDPARR